MLFFSLAFSSIMYGVLLAALGVAALLFVVRLLRSACRFSVATAFLALVLFFTLLFQMSLLCGAASLRSTVDDLRVEAERLTVKGENPDARQAVRELMDEYPLLQKVTDGEALSTGDAHEVISSLADEADGWLSAYIWRRVWWSLAECVAVGVLVAVTMERQRSRGGRVAASAQTHGRRARRRTR